MIVTKKLLVMIAILPTYIFAMEIEMVPMKSDLSTTIPGIMKRIVYITKNIELSDGGTEKYYSNNMRERSWNNRKIREIDYPENESNIIFERWDENPTTEYSQANPSYKFHDLHMQITNNQMTLTPNNPEYIAGHDKLSQGSAFGIFKRDGQTIKTIANPNGSFVEDDGTSLSIITNTEKYDNYGHHREQFKRIKYIDKSSARTRTFAFPASDYSSNNPIVEYMQQRKTIISQKAIF